MKILVTGSAGFIGMHVCIKLLDQGHEVIGIDNLNDYYEISLKNDRTENIKSKHDFTFIKLDISNKNELLNLAESYNFDIVINLAAQGGVRYSIINPDSYIKNNMIGFYNILEYVRNNNIKKLLYASSSSVYGLSTKENFNENDDTDNPISLYAATKKSNELLAHSYSHLYNIGTAGLRFFTVYGPWGRPDMALFSFVRSILNGQEIEIYNHGKMTRDFTYIDDISNAVAKIAELDFSKIEHNTINKNKNFSIYNIGNSQPRSLMEYVEALENKIGITAKKKYLPIQLGDVLRTSSCTKLLNQLIDYKPSTDIEQGISHFVDWYCDYYESNYPGR